MRDLFEFVLRWDAWMRARGASLLLHPITRAPLIDLSIYTANRPMRLAFSRKPGGSPLISAHDNMREALWVSLVCCSMSSDPNDLHSFPTYDHTREDGTNLTSKALKARKRPRPVATPDESILRWLK